MKNTGRFVFCLAALMISLPAVAGNRSKRGNKQPARDVSGANDSTRAVGVVDVFLFKNREISQRCTATHVGNGLMVTAGHCFLGSWDCNDARVSWENESFTSRCQYIVYSNASESYSNGREISNDLTVFKIDRWPEAVVSLSPGIKPEDKQFATSAVAISKNKSSNSTSTKTSAPCNLVFGPVVNIFSQPKPSDTAKHNCELSDISSGSPLINTNTNQLIAIHQGTSLLPDLESSSSDIATQLIHYAKIIADIDIQKATSLPDAMPSNIRIGGFAGEVLSTGIKEPLNLRIANVQAKSGQTTVSFSVHNGLDSVIEAVGSDGGKIIFAGPRRAGHEQRFRLKAPVRFNLTSSRGGIAPLAWIEDIQSP
ncbi:MAG: trypsin-like peptidase domain-containing protein [Silvanigrellaceae bacterium]